MKKYFKDFGSDFGSKVVKDILKSTKMPTMNMSPGKMAKMPKMKTMSVTSIKIGVPKSKIKF